MQIYAPVKSEFIWQKTIPKLLILNNFITFHKIYGMHRKTSYLRTFWFIILLFSITHVSAQISDGDKVETKSPEPPVQNFGFKGDFLNTDLVNLKNGSVAYSVFLFSMDNEGIKLDLNLSYASSGYRPAEYASEVGLGWSLNGLPSIQREVRGVADDESGGHFKVAPNEIIGSTAPSTFYAPITCLGLLNYSANQLTPTQHLMSGTAGVKAEYAFMISCGARDGEYDIFSFSIEGENIKFIIKNGEPFILRGDPKYAISYERYGTDENPNPYDDSKWIKSFEVDAPSGNIYRFNQPNSVHIRAGEVLSGGTVFVHYSMSGTDQLAVRGIIDFTAQLEDDTKYHNEWVLTSITNQQSGSELVVSEFYPMTQTETMIGNRRYLRVYQSNDYGPYPVISGPYLSTSFKYSIHYLPKKIEFNGSQLDFNYGVTDREDIPSNGSTSLGSLFGPDEAVNARALKSITLRRNDNGDQIEKVSFTFSYLEGGDISGTVLSPELNKKLILKSVTRGYFDAGVEVETEPYTFSYQNENDPIPHTLSMRTDIWGYYSNNHHNGIGPFGGMAEPQLWEYSFMGYDTPWGSNRSSIPRNTTNSFDFNAGSTFRSPSFNDASKFLLNTIQIPLKGEISFDYGLNQFISPDGLLLNGGGVRVESIKFKDNSELTKEVDFNYDIEGASSGKILSVPIFNALSQATEVVNYSSIGRATMYQGSPVVYKQVEVLNSDGGKTVNVNNFDYSIFDSPSECEGSDCFFNFSPNTTKVKVMSSSGTISWGMEGIMASVFAPVSNYTDFQGELVEKRIYDNAGNIIQKQEFNYSIPNWSKEKISNCVSNTFNTIPVTNTTECVAEYRFYDILKGWKRLDEVVITDYDSNGGDPVQSSKLYTYNHEHDITEEREIQSDGREFFKQNTYSYELEISSGNDVWATGIKSLNDIGISRIIESRSGIIDENDNYIYRTASLNLYDQNHLTEQLSWHADGSTFNEVEVSNNTLDFDQNYEIENIFTYLPNSLQPKVVTNKMGNKTIYKWMNNNRDLRLKCYPCGEDEFFYTGFEIEDPKPSIGFSTGILTNADSYSGVSSYIFVPYTSSGTTLGFEVNGNDQDLNYFMAAWIKGAESIGSGENFKLVISLYNATTNALIQTFNQNIDLENEADWQRVSANFNIEPYIGAITADNIRVKCELTNYTSNYLKIDDIRLTSSSSVLEVKFNPPLRPLQSEFGDNQLGIFYQYDNFNRLSTRYNYHREILEKTEYNIR